MTQKELLKKLGKRIKQLRAEKGVSQQELASKCDFEKSNMSRLESGNTNPTVGTLLKISQALKIGLQELFKFE